MNGRLTHLSLDLGACKDLRYHVEQEVYDTNVQKNGNEEAPCLCIISDARLEVQQDERSGAPAEEKPPCPQSCSMEHVEVEELSSKQESWKEGGRASTSFIHLIDQQGSRRPVKLLGLRDEAGTDIDEHFGGWTDHIVESRRSRDYRARQLLVSNQFVYHDAGHDCLVS